MKHGHASADRPAEYSVWQSMKQRAGEDRDMSHSSDNMDLAGLLDRAARPQFEICASVCGDRAEAQSVLQKRAYDEGRDKDGEGHWRAQCELREAAAEIRALAFRKDALTSLKASS